MLLFFFPVPGSLGQNISIKKNNGRGTYTKRKKMECRGFVFSLLIASSVFVSGIPKETQIIDVQCHPNLISPGEES